MDWIVVVCNGLIFFVMYMMWLYHVLYVIMSLFECCEVGKRSIKYEIIILPMMLLQIMNAINVYVLGEVGINWSVVMILWNILVWLVMVEDICEDEVENIYKDMLMVLEMKIIFLSLCFNVIICYVLWI